MTAKYTEATTAASIVSTELNSLADDTAALGSSAQSNDASTERCTLATFYIVVAAQTARDSGASNIVSLLIVPEVGTGVYGDTATLLTAGNSIAQYEDGSAVSFVLDDAVTARTFTAAGVKIPNGNFKVGLLNTSSQALAASGNSISMTGAYSYDDV